MADATKIGVADATKMGVANARVANATQPFLVLCFCCVFDNFPLFANHSLTFPDWSSPKFKDRDQFETGRI